MSIEAKVLTIISKIAQKPVQSGEELLSTGLIDSMSAMDLMLAIKQEFGIEVPFDQIIDIFANTDNLVSFVKNNTKA